MKSRDLNKKLSDDYDNLVKKVYEMEEVRK